MTLFWITCAVLLIVALPFVVLPLWRNSGNNAGGDKEVQRDAANLEILRDQSAELEADLRDDLLTQDAYEQGKRELQARLLEEVKTSGQPIKPPRRSARTLAIVLAILLPLFSVPLYLTLGNTKALLPQQDAVMAGDFGVIRSEAKLQELEKKLEQQPEDPDGWVVLARSYAELQRFPDAVRAYGQLVKLVPDEAQIWASYADVYAMTNNQSLLGEPTRFLNKALELDGNNTMALALAGSAAMERGDYAAAIAHWTKLADLLPQDNAELQMIRDGIKQARQFLAMQKGGKERSTQLQVGKAPGKAADNPASAISGRVSLSPALAGKAAPEDTVFIFARDAEASKTLLAVLRKQVKDLPLQFTLDDGMAMQPQAKLSGFNKIEVVARITKSGNPVSQPGDLQGSTGIVKPGTKGLNIVIDTAIK
ncbi:MAG: c-type cytochrome biogenesis protein CcmI [Gallionellales bacterium GWA2_55_18]|nr:MAG: c-type cytochrome biogenesis protein CcmI [Gallionellales bacterium GWA2_55_18]